MDTNDFWGVKIGQGMGALALGMTAAEAEGILKGANLDGLKKERKTGVVLAFQRGSCKLFFDDATEQLHCLSIADHQVHFSSWMILGKPIHKVVRLFKCRPEEVLWRIDAPPSESFDPTWPFDQATSSPVTDGELLTRGTLWIPALGLGFLVKRGVVVTLFICDPAEAPQRGIANWNQPQQVMSEKGLIPDSPHATIPLERNPYRYWLYGLLPLALLWVAWSTYRTQMRWNTSPAVEAHIVSVEPPPPHPIGERFQAAYADPKGSEHLVFLDRMAFYEAPKMGDRVKLRFLADNPDAPLGPRQVDDVGFDHAVPRLVAVFVVHGLLLWLIPLYRRRPRV